MEFFDFIAVLGSGGCGTVLAGKRKDATEIVAIKVQQKALIFERNRYVPILHSLLLEKSILENLTHPNLIKMKEAFPQRYEALSLPFGAIGGWQIAGWCQSGA